MLTDLLVKHLTNYSDYRWNFASKTIHKFHLTVPPVSQRKNARLHSYLAIIQETFEVELILK